LERLAALSAEDWRRVEAALDVGDHVEHRLARLARDFELL
jgi:hypothetical protein